MAPVEYYLDIKLLDMKILWSGVGDAELETMRRSIECGERASSDSSGVHVWLVLMKAHWSMTRPRGTKHRFARHVHLGFRVLEALVHKGPQSVVIGRHVDLTAVRSPRRFDRLEQRGLVARAKHASDRRARWSISHPMEKRGSRRRSPRTRRPWTVPPMACRRATTKLISLLKATRTTADHQLTEGTGIMTAKSIAVRRRPNHREPVNQIATDLPPSRLRCETSRIRQAARSRPDPRRHRPSRLRAFSRARRQTRPRVRGLVPGPEREL